MAGPKANAQYEAVREKIARGLSVGEAKEAVALELGVGVATVHTNYYRVARENNSNGAGEILAKRRKRTPLSITVQTPSEELVRTALDALAELARRNELLEKDSERLRRIERTISDTP